MKLFKISIKFEQNGKWSERQADTEGYLVKKNENDDIVEGYVKALYHTSYDSVRYIKGLHFNNSLVFIQMCNVSSVSPICYSFPDVKNEGFWSGFNENGFFPMVPATKCSDGHATIQIEEVEDETKDKIVEETSKIFEKEASDPTWINQCLMEDFKSLKDFLNEQCVFQMKLHCGKW